MARITCRGKDCNATFSTAFNRNKHENKFQHFFTSKSERGIAVNFDDTAKVYKCKNPSCQTTSKKKSNMLRHIRTCSNVTANKKIRANNKVCAICAIKFTSKFNRNRHMETIHSKHEMEDITENVPDSAPTSTMSTTTHNIETDFDLDINEMGPISMINTLSSPNDTDNTDFDETAYDTDFSEITPNPLFSSPISNIVIEAGSNSNVTPNVPHDSTSNSIQFNIVEELIEAHGKRDRFNEERFTSLVLSKIEDDYKSGCSPVKYSLVKYLLEVFGEMLFENGFLNWLCRKINVRKPGLEACIHDLKLMKQTSLGDNYQLKHMHQSITFGLKMRVV